MTSSLQQFHQMLAQAGTPRAPDFFGIGAEKCGTTWLWQMFRDHPEIGVPVPKELRYFSHQYLGTGLKNFTMLQKLLGADGGTRALGAEQADRLVTELRIAFGSDDAYLRIFGDLSGSAVGDISPQYCMLPPEGVAHMRRLAPEAKIIFLMRDPVERTISGGNMKAAGAQEAPSEAAVRERALVPFQIEMSHYSAALESFEAAFPGRVFTGFIDDIRERPLAFLEELCGFLGVSYDPAHFPRIGKVANAGRRVEVSDALRREIHACLEDEYARLAERFPDRVACWRAAHEARHGG